MGLWGYSGGAFASANAAQLQPRYAPELDFRAVALGGLLGDVRATIEAGVMPTSPRRTSAPPRGTPSTSAAARSTAWARTASVAGCSPRSANFPAPLLQNERVMKVGVAVVAGAIILALGAWGGWVLWAGRAADQVDAFWTLDCAGTRVGTHEGEPAIRSRPGWRCDVDLTIANGSGRSVQVDRVRSPIIGPGGGAEIQALSTDDAELAAGPDEIDAEWDVDLVVPAGESRRLTIAVGWRADGCNDAGHLSLENWPTVELEVLGRSYEDAPEQRLILRTFNDPHDRGGCGIS